MVRGIPLQPFPPFEPLSPSATTADDPSLYFLRQCSSQKFARTLQLLIKLRMILGY
jgi:hypothetical protein